MGADWSEDLIRHLDEEFIPAVRELPGFQGYLALEGGPRLFASVTLFEDRPGAEASNRLAAEFVQKQLIDVFPSLPEITAGVVRAGAFAEAFPARG
jgi:hypothetical protein